MLFRKTAKLLTFNSSMANNFQDLCQIDGICELNPGRPANAMHLRQAKLWQELDTPEEPYGECDVPKERIEILFFLT